MAAGVADGEIKPKLEVCRGVGEIVAAKMSSVRIIPLAPRLQCPIAEASSGYSTDAMNERTLLPCHIHTTQCEKNKLWPRIAVA